ncbi:MAG: quinolinate synthase NadA, partial [Alicyclobacillus macrosporangiidus]|uniref:quinolinate synthase NadA n=1 Tax=Alicyclobacillus macrosporangiidus TaxID=392015 RepID=UPI0026EE4D3C
MAVRMEAGTAAGLIEEILRLKREKNAVILAHNYQRPEVQELADVLGDSLALARAAAKTDADVIVFCGVHFMAETAAVLNPEKTVLLPDLEAGCSLADSITADQLRAWKADHPEAVVVAYVNTSAEVKAESDYCCTSSNAIEVVQSIPEDREILFLPDMFLGAYVQRVTGRQNMHIWMGECHVHAGIQPTQVETVLRQHPRAELLVHPECGCSTPSVYLAGEGVLPADRTRILSTGGMLKHASSSEAEEFIVATETGILYQMQKRNPGKR